MSPPPQSTLSRRALLGGAAVGATAVLAGCAPSAIPIIGAPDPDDEVRRGVALSEQELLAAYDAAIAAGTGSTELLRSIRDQHAAHLAAVSDGLDIPVLASPSPAPGQRPSLRQLRRLEARAVPQRIKACTAAGDADLAELIARIGASESGHVAALGPRGGSA